MAQRPPFVYHQRSWLLEGSIKPEIAFATAYAVCAVIALAASRTRSGAVAAETAHFWLRIGVVCAAFSMLRYIGAQRAVSSVVRDVGHSNGLIGLARPGPILMLLAVGALGIALAGLLFFRLRTVHTSVVAAALSIVGLILLAIAHSVSLYWTGVYLQAEVGTLTVSRIIETVLLMTLAVSGLCSWSHTAVPGPGCPLQENPW